MSYLLKDPLASVDYSVDWRADYLGDDDHLADSRWSVDPLEPGGLAIEADSFTLSQTRAVAGGGVAGRIYRLTNRILTAAGIEDQRSITIRVEAR